MQLLKTIPEINLCSQGNGFVLLTGQSNDCYEAHTPTNSPFQSRAPPVWPYMDIRKKHTGFVECVFFISVAVKKNAWRQGPFMHLVLLKLTVPGLWRLYFGVLSRQISSPEHFLELQLTILAWKLYASCACCVNIKFRVHVYSVFVWISLDSLVAVAVSVCRFRFASVTR